jgi:glycosyltransferase involved in cell wall biosynthesis
LLIVGRDGWGCEALVSRLRAGTQPHVRWLNYVPRPDLPVLLSRATALLFPSLHEGFGLPVLEGFAAGTPVVAANTTSIPEVAGDAAILADPLDWMAWRDQMLKMTGSPDGIEERIRLGRQRARLFSWSNTVRELTRLYVQVAGSHTG